MVIILHGDRRKHELESLDLFFLGMIEVPTLRKDKKLIKTPFKQFLFIIV